MMIKKLLAMLFGMGSAGVSVPVALEPASLDEMLTYECAKHIVDLTPIQFQNGPIFYREGVLMSSVNTARGDKLLIVNAGSGTFAVPLYGSGVSRVTFSIPMQGQLKALFISYSHDRESRLFEFSQDHAPAGKDHGDFKVSHARRATELLPHFEFALFETLETLVARVTAKKVQHHEMALPNVAMCDHISRRSPALARTLRYDLGLIASVLQSEMPAANPTPGRMPASLALIELLGK
jgi:hypothetical protein